MNYDSRYDTIIHITEVRTRMLTLFGAMLNRAGCHDSTKLGRDEKPIFDEFTPLLAQTEYGSDEYKAQLEAMSPAIRHHYAHNRHHPEHHPNGIDDMDLVDLVEMISDWKAATGRNSNGSMAKSLAINADRFGIGPQLLAILTNTAKRYFDPVEEEKPNESTD